MSARENIIFVLIKLLIKNRSEGWKENQKKKSSRHKKKHKKKLLSCIARAFSHSSVNISNAFASETGWYAFSWSRYDNDVNKDCGKNRDEQ